MDAGGIPNLMVIDRKLLSGMTESRPFIQKGADFS
jgi:hypothetical protein